MAGRAAQAGGRATDPSPHGGRVDVTVVTAEQLVAAVSGEAHRHVPACELRDEERRNLRRVAERLVVERREAGHDLERVGAGHVQLGVVRAEVRGDGLGRLRFVVARVG